MGIYFGLVLFAIYFIPSFLAYNRKHSKFMTLLLTNLLFGWTGIIWFLCLIWVFTDNKQKRNLRLEPINTPAGEQEVLASHADELHQILDFYFAIKHSLESGIEHSTTIQDWEEDASALLRKIKRKLYRVVSQ